MGDVLLPRKLPTFGQFITETLKIGDKDVQDVIDGIYDLLKGAPDISKEDIINGLKDEFEIEATDDQLIAIIDGVKKKGLNISE